MKKATLLSVVLALTLALVGPAAAGGVVNFDDINTSGGYAQIPSGYAGFTWDTNFFAEQNDYYKSLYNNTIDFPSQANAAAPTGVKTLSASRRSLFNLDGAYFSGWAENDRLASYSVTELQVTGSRGGKPVGSVTFALTPLFVYQHLGFTNIDTVTFTATKWGEDTWGVFWLLDNMTYTTPIPGAILPLLLLVD